MGWAVLCWAINLSNQPVPGYIHHNVIRYDCPSSIAMIFTEKIDVRNFCAIEGVLLPVPPHNNLIPFHAGKHFLEVGCQILLPSNNSWVEGLPELCLDNAARLVCYTVNILGKISFGLLTNSTKTFDDYQVIPSEWKKFNIQNLWA